MSAAPASVCQHNDVVAGLLCELHITLAYHASGALVQLATDAIKAVRHIQDSPRLSIVSDHVARHFRMPHATLFSCARDQRTALARHLAMYLWRTLTAASFPAIGEHFHRHHATVMHGVNLIQSRMEAEPSFRTTVEHLERELLAADGSATTAAAA